MRRKWSILILMYIYSTPYYVSRTLRAWGTTPFGLKVVRPLTHLNLGNKLDFSREIKEYQYSVLSPISQSTSRPLGPTA